MHRDRLYRNMAADLNAAFVCNAYATMVVHRLASVSLPSRRIRDPRQTTHTLCTPSRRCAPARREGAVVMGERLAAAQFHAGGRCSGRPMIAGALLFGVIGVGGNATPSYEFHRMTASRSS